MLEKDLDLSELLERKAKVDEVLRETKYKQQNRYRRCLSNVSLLDVGFKELESGYSILSALMYKSDVLSIYIQYKRRQNGDISDRVKK